jgi:hypothetical protein
MSKKKSFLRESSVKIGTIQRRLALAWPLRTLAWMNIYWQRQRGLSVYNKASALVSVKTRELATARRPKLKFAYYEY